MKLEEGVVMGDINGIKRVYSFKLASMFKASKKTLFVFEDEPPKPPSSLLEKVVDKIVYPKRLNKPDEVVDKLLKGEKLRFELGALEREVGSLEDLDKLAKDWGLGSPDEEIVLPHWAEKDEVRHQQEEVGGTGEDLGSFILSDKAADTFLSLKKARGGVLRSLELEIAPERAVNSIVEKEFRRIKEIAPQVAKLSDEQLRAKTAEFRRRIAEGEDMLSILPEAYAVVAEAAKRVLGYYPTMCSLKGL